jgi:mono/diheme cytochrome c family protein
MKGKTLMISALVWGGVLFMLPACQGGGGYTAPPPPQAAAPEQPTAPAQGYTMGPGTQHGYGMMQHDDQRHGMMGGGGMGGGMMEGGGMMGGQGYQGYQQQYRGRTGGAGLFAANCASCHPNGGNRIIPNMPLRGAPQLGSYSSFRAIVRRGRGAMPAFPSSAISDSQLQELYRYVRSAFGG